MRFLCAFFAGFAYLLFADALPNGQSLGKRLLSIATVDSKTRKGCSLSQSFTRNAGVLVIIDWVCIFLESRTRLGDMFAKTIVIQTGNLTTVRSLADIYDDGKAGAVRGKSWMDDKFNDLLHFAAVLRGAMTCVVCVVWRHAASLGFSRTSSLLRRAIRVMRGIDGVHVEHSRTYKTHHLC